MTTRRPDARAGMAEPLQLADALELQPPTSAEPGYWKTADGFIAVNAGLLRDGAPAGERLRALISFEPGDVHQATKERVRDKLPDIDQMTQEQRRSQWALILRLGKEARTERVSEIVTALANQGVLLDTEAIVVHRVSNTFFASLEVEKLVRLVELRAQGFADLRRMVISSVAGPNPLPKKKPVKK